MPVKQPCGEIELRGAIREGMVCLESARVPSHILAAELLLMHVLGRDRAWLYARPEYVLTARDAERFFHLVSQRASGVPTQYLTGRQEFWGLEFEVTPDVLIPRPETEHVVEVALKRLETARAGRKLRVIDVCTGSGCLAISLAHELSHAIVIATDISAAALAVARRNAIRHGVAHRVHFVQADLLEPFTDQRATRPDLQPADLIVCNPPYVGLAEANQLSPEVRDHEPASAIFGGDDGAAYYCSILTQSGNLLRPGGQLILELSYNGLVRVFPLLESGQSWVNVEFDHDLAGVPRVLAAERS